MTKKNNYSQTGDVKIYPAKVTVTTVMAKKEKDCCKNTKHNQIHQTGWKEGYAKGRKEERKELREKIEKVKNKKADTNKLKMRIGGMPDLQCWSIGYGDGLDDLLEELK